MTQLQRILFEPSQDVDVRRVKQPQDEIGAQATAQVKETRPSEDHSVLMAEAETYLQLLSNELGNSSFYFKRLDEVCAEIIATGIYQHTYEELAYGAKVAWTNNKRCIGRLPWKSLHVIDKRSLSTAQEIFEAAVEHIRYSTNNGRIRPTITIFAAQTPGQPGIRIWNSQLIRYAGYRRPDGSVIGDPMHVEFTEVVRKLGWKFESGTHFDILPLVIQMPGQCPKLFELPRDVILEVPISHPDYSWFAELGLKWHALPAISNMCLEIGGHWFFIVVTRILLLNQTSYTNQIHGRPLKKRTAVLCINGVIFGACCAIFELDKVSELAISLYSLGKSRSRPEAL